VEALSRGLPAERCLAVLLDGDVVRLFRVGEDRVEELGDSAPRARVGTAASGSVEASAADPGRTGGGRRTRTRCRHGDPDLPVLPGPGCDHVHRTAERVAALVRNEHIGRILAGGAPDCVAEFRRLLRARLGGDIETLSLSTRASADQVHAAARGRCRAEPTSREEQVLGELIDGIGRGLAALGLAAVLDAVNDHRVAVLLVAGAHATTGATCAHCGHLFAAPAPADCPTCGAPLGPVPDLVERLAAHVRERAGTVEHIGGPAGNALASHDGIAALLRCAFPGSGLSAPWEEVATV
jgi:hypothetical protein